MAGRLSRDEREEIRSGLDRGWSYRRIGAWIGRHSSTVHREVAANGGRGRYRASRADRRARECARRPQPRKLVSDPVLRAAVITGLETMSPAPLSRVLATQGFSVCPETIYRELFRHDSVLGDTYRHLARSRPYRKRRRHGHTRRDTKPLGAITLVTQRHVDLPATPGHWEGDLLVGARNTSAVIVLTERTSRIVILGALQSQTTDEVVPATIELLNQIPHHMRQSLCWDQGRELTNWRDIENQLDIDVFFCHPRSPWEKPLVENTYGHLRRWLPRKTNLYRPQTELDTIANRLNTMPRKSLNWDTATNRYRQLVATTM